MRHDFCVDILHSKIKIKTGTGTERERDLIIDDFDQGFL